MLSIISQHLTYLAYESKSKIPKFMMMTVNIAQLDISSEVKYNILNFN